MNDNSRSFARTPTRRLLLSGLLSLTACETVGGGRPSQTETHEGPLAPWARGTLAHLETWPEPKAIADFEMTDRDGDRLSVKDRLNRINLVYFWALWLAPAAKELPQLAALQTRFDGKGLNILAVNIDDREHASEASEVMEANRPLRFYQANKGINLAADLKFNRLPVALILDKTGREIARLEGDTSWLSSDVLEFFEAALSSDSRAYG
jgi:thiol-disulfide isomerase/thioredoxin